MSTAASAAREQARERPTKKTVRRPAEFLKRGKKMKLTENKDKRITVRLSQSDYDYMRVASYMAGITISKYFRQLIDATVNAMKLQERKGTFDLAEMLEIIGETEK